MTSLAKILKKYLRLPGGTDYSLSLQMPAFSLSRLADSLINEVLPTSVWSDSLLVDLKGRDEHDLIDQNLSEDSKPSGDELVFVEGWWFSGVLEERQSPSDLIGHKFQIRVETPFSAFLSDNHIQFKKEERAANFPKQVPILAVAQAFPIHLERLRLGICLYEAHSRSSIFGLSATIDETLLIEADAVNFNLRITSENGSPRRPFSRFEIFPRLARVLTDVLNFDLSQDYSIKAP